MKLTRRLFAAAAIGALSALPLSLPAQATELSDVEAAGKVRIGMLVTFPPFGLLDASGNPDGYDHDVAVALADYMGLELDLVQVSGPNRIPYLLSGQVDILVASLGITEERKQKVDFSDPYAGISIGVYGDSTVEVANAADLSGKTIGLSRGSTQETAVSAIAPDDADLRRFDDGAGAVQALMSGQVQLLGVSNVVMNDVMKATGDRFNKKFDLSSQVQGIVVAPGSDALLEKVNAFIAQIKSDGTLDGIHQKWLGEPLPEFIRGDS